MDLRYLNDSDLEKFEKILYEYPGLKCSELRDLLKKEQTRRNLPELSGTEVVSKFLLKYVRFDLSDGLGGYEVWKVAKINDYGNKTYSLYPSKPIVSNVDGIYSIDTYLDEVIIETSDDLRRITVITKEEYDSEFSKAIEYYKSLKTND